MTRGDVTKATPIFLATPLGSRVTMSNVACCRSHEAYKRKGTFNTNILLHNQSEPHEQRENLVRNGGSSIALL